MIARLSLLPTLKNFISNKEENDDWVYSNGYIGQHGDVSKNTKADFLNGHPQIKTSTFDEFGNFEKTLIPEDAYFWNTRVAELYQAPHIIFKLVLEKSKIPMTYSNEYLCFNSSFVGIHAPLSDEHDLYQIYDRLHKNEKTSSLYQSFILATSAKAMVYHETSIIKDDFDNLPYPKKLEHLSLSTTEHILIDDLLKYYIHSAKAISGRGEGKKLHEQVDKHQLEQFGQVFCDTLNPIYARNGQSWQFGSFAQTNSFTIFQLGYGVNNGLPFQSLDPSDDIISPLIYDSTSHRGAVFTRVARIYKHINGYDCVFLIKPSAIRYWLNSIALRDADETFVDLREAGR